MPKPHPWLINSELLGVGSGHWLFKASPISPLCSQSGETPNTVHSPRSASHGEGQGKSRGDGWDAGEETRCVSLCPFLLVLPGRHDHPSGVCKESVPWAVVETTNTPRTGAGQWASVSWAQPQSSCHPLCSGCRSTPHIVSLDSWVWSRTTLLLPVCSPLPPPLLSSEDSQCPKLLAWPRQSLSLTLEAERPLPLGEISGDRAQPKGKWAPKVLSRR